jgi:hypothetical protein
VHFVVAVVVLCTTAPRDRKVAAVGGFLLIEMRTTAASLSDHREREPSTAAGITAWARYEARAGMEA